MSILVVGSVAFDTIKSPSGSVEKELGGAATYFGLSASYFTDVRVVAVVGEDFGPEQEAVFKKREHRYCADCSARRARRFTGAANTART